MKNLLCLLALAPAALHAETFTIDTDVSAVTMYPQGVQITRSGSFDVPAGTHRLVLLGVPAHQFAGVFPTMQFQAAGLTRTALILREEDVPWHDYVSASVKQAEERITEIEARMQAVRDQADTARLKADAARHSLAFLSSLGRNEGLAGSDADALRSIARMIGDESLAAENAAQAAEIEAREIEARLTDLETELEAARADLAALLPETGERMFVAVDVSAPQDAQGTLTLSYLDSYGGYWQPTYDFDLTTGDTPQVQITRGIIASQDTGENWQDVTLSVSTLQPIEQNQASDVQATRRYIREKVANLAEPVVEATPVFEVTERWTPDAASVAGTGTTYTLPVPISISSGSSAAEFELDSMTQSAELFALANPRRDKTAYRTARFANPYAQNLLSTDFARWSVDGTLVATDSSPEIGPREQIEMGFGPLFGLTLQRRILNRSSGDVGLISRSNESVEQVQIRVENLTDQTWPMRLLDSVPYSEQDDLQITWSAQPKPDEENVDNQRGILAWDMQLAPDQVETIQLDTKLSWPEGMVLE